jgi:nicotinamidase-related amidase
MTSPTKPRDSHADPLLTPQNAALVIIDFQPVQVTSIASMERRELVANITAVARTAKLFGLPIVLSTVNVGTGRNQPTIHQLTEVLGAVEAIDRIFVNSGGHAIHEDSVIQRFWRDAHAGSLHNSNVAEPILSAYGALRFGDQQPNTPF